MNIDGLVHIWQPVFYKYAVVEIADGRTGNTIRYTIYEMHAHVTNILENIKCRQRTTSLVNITYIYTHFVLMRYDISCSAVNNACIVWN